MKRWRVPGLLNPAAWPLSVKIPMAVALLMICVSAVISNRVLTRLTEIQERHVEQLASAYMDGLSASLVPSVVRDDIWEVFDTLDRSRQRYQALNVRWTAVTDGSGKLIAASDPAHLPTEAALPAGVAEHFAAAAEVKFDRNLATAFLARPLTYQNRAIGNIYAEADIAPLLKERWEVAATLVLTNGALTLLIAAAGYVAIRRMISPLTVLSAHLKRGAHGPLQPIPEAEVRRQSGEFGDLFARYNAVAIAVNEREMLASRLAEEEKLASLGRLASGLAHEINNPLGGMLNALDSLKRHSDRETVRTTSVRLLEQGLTGIRDLVRSTLAVYRADQNSRQLAATDLDDLRLLIAPEIKRKQLTLNWQNEVEGLVAAPAGPVRDAILNLLLNACEASPSRGLVAFEARVESDELSVVIDDSGGGLPDQVKEYLEKPGAGAAPLDRRSGLGLWMVKRVCAELGGNVAAVTTPGVGTRISLTIPLGREVLRHVA